MSSVAFDKIVPFGQYFILDDMPLALTFKEWVTLCLCLIDSSVDRCEHSESCLCSCFGCQFACLLNGVEYRPAPYSGYLREEPVLDGVPLGAVRRIMGNPDVNAQPLRQLDKPPLELPAPCIVRAASVAEDKDGLCTWIYVPDVLLPLLGEAFAGKLCGVVAHSKGHVASVPCDIVDAVRHHLAIGERGIVMVVDLYGFSSIGSAVVTPVQAKQLLLLRVNTEYWYAVLFAVSAQLPNDLELLVAQLAVCHGQGLHRLATSVALCLDDLPDGIEAYGYMILFCEYALYLRGSQAKPLRAGILRKTGYVKSHYLAEDGYVLGMDGKSALPAASLLADSAPVEVFAAVKFMESPIDGISRDRKNAADKTYALPAVPFCYNGSELPRLPLVQVLKVLHLLVCYYICWIIRDLHNCLEFSYKGTNYSADLQI